MKVNVILSVLIAAIIVASCTAKKSEAEKIAQYDYENILKGDLSSFAGIWVNGIGETRELKPNGTFGYDGKIVKYTNNDDGTYSWSVDSGDGGYAVRLFPVGVEAIDINDVPTDTAKVRIYTYMHDLVILADRMYYLATQVTTQPQTQTGIEETKTSTETQSETSDLPKVMYVNSENGLRGRAEPSTSSSVVETLLYGQRIATHEKGSIPVTIDGITDYWYKISHQEGWLFGAYLSTNLPSNVPIILGLWEQGRDIFNFSPNHGYKVGRKESNWFDIGKWELNGNTLILTQTSDGWEDIDNAESVVIDISIINENDISLMYGGNQYNLIRSDYPYTFY